MNSALNVWPKFGGTSVATMKHGYLCEDNRPTNSNTRLCLKRFCWGDKPLVALANTGFD